MFKYAEFNNYGLRLPFDEKVIGLAGKAVPGAWLTDIRAQALRLSPGQRAAMLKKPFAPCYSAGIWFFGEGSSRFHGSYKDRMEIERRLQIAAELAPYGLKALEAHEPWEINEGNLHLFDKLRRETGIVISQVAGIGGDFRQVDAQFGTTSSPIKEVRDKYAAHTVEQLKLTRRVTEAQGYPAIAVCWPGIDGYTYSLGTDFYDMWDRFEAALAEAMDEVPGVRVVIEPKPYEPAINNIWRNTADGLTMARNVEARLSNPLNLRLIQEGHCLVGLNPEIGHVRMGFEDVAFSYSAVMREARLAHTHWNAQPLGNFDQDLNCGVVAPETLEALSFVLRLYGYSGFYGLDINPEKMPVEAALAKCFNAIELANGVVDNIDPEEILEAYHNPHVERGKIEDIITRARARGIDSSRLIPRAVVSGFEKKPMPF
ncbi:MAG TPA: xylose isomerase [archaeon]|nr:xylose isomerase [archaeon]